MKQNIKLNKKIVALSIGVVFIGMSITSNAATIKKNENKQQNNQQIVKVEEKFVGVNKDGKKYADDAKKVAEKLNNYDYTNDGKKWYI
ncbi:MAG: hypothetical protein ACRCX2_16155 [Paraclostridium sp.]